jgi:hypothetical protein
MTINEETSGPTRGSSRLGKAVAKINLKCVSVIPGKMVVNDSLAKRLNRRPLCKEDAE